MKLRHQTAEGILIGVALAIGAIAVVFASMGMARAELIKNEVHTIDGPACSTLEATENVLAAGAEAGLPAMVQVHRMMQRAHAPDGRQLCGRLRGAVQPVATHGSAEVIGAGKLYIIEVETKMGAFFIFYPEPLAAGRPA